MPELITGDPTTKPGSRISRIEDTLEEIKAEAPERTKEVPPDYVNAVIGFLKNKEIQPGKEGWLMKKHYRLGRDHPEFQKRDKNKLRRTWFNSMNGFLGLLLDELHDAPKYETWLQDMRRFVAALPKGKMPTAVKNVYGMEHVAYDVLEYLLRTGRMPSPDAMIVDREEGDMEEKRKRYADFFVWVPKEKQKAADAYRNAIEPVVEKTDYAIAMAGRLEAVEEEAVDETAEVGRWKEQAYEALIDDVAKTDTVIRDLVTKRDATQKKREAENERRELKGSLQEEVGRFLTNLPLFPYEALGSLQSAQHAYTEILLEAANASPQPAWSGAEMQNLVRDVVENINSALALLLEKDNAKTQRALSETMGQYILGKANQLILVPSKNRAAAAAQTDKRIAAMIQESSNPEQTSRALKTIDFLFERAAEETFLERSNKASKERIEAQRRRAQLVLDREEIFGDEKEFFTREPSFSSRDRSMIQELLVTIERAIDPEEHQIKPNQWDSFGYENKLRGDWFTVLFRNADTLLEYYCPDSNRTQEWKSAIDHVREKVTGQRGNTVDDIQNAERITLEIIEYFKRRLAHPAVSVQEKAA